MKMISQFLTPIKFSLILLLIILGIYWAPASLSTLPESTGIFSKIGEGVLSGYNTMDLTAAIFFAAIIMKFFSRVDSHPRQVLKDGLWSCLIGASLLTGIYVCFVYLGAKYIHITDHVPDIEVLPIIAQHALGNFAGVVFSLTIVFSCLTTSVALTTCWIDTLNQLNVLITTPYWLKLTLSLLISYVISVFFGFASILSILGPILQYIYPLLIIMAITHIVKERLAL